MAFTIDGIVIDRIQMGIAEKTDGTPLYVLTQLTDATINVSAESKEAKDANGTLIKKFYTGKTGTFEAKNALVDFNILAEGTGSPKKVASSSAKITMPGVKTVAVGSMETVTLKGIKTDSLISVMGIAANGTMIKSYKKDSAAGVDAYSITGETLTLPKDAAPANFVVKYEREVSAGVEVTNRTDKFPGTIKLTLKALAVDPCDPSTVRSCLIVLPSFQVSPEVSLSLSTDAQLDYKGDLQTSYCGNEKVTNIINL